MSKASLVLVDDHPILLRGLASILSEERHLGLIETGSSAGEAVAIAKKRRPQIMVLDINMPGNAFEAIAAIRDVSPETRIVVFTASTGPETAVRALEAGASAYVVKGSTIDVLKGAIEAVLNGDTFISQDMAYKVISLLRAAPKPASPMQIRLSVREEQVVRLLISGKTNREIATELGIGEKTVKHYMTVLMQKLHVRNRLEVAMAAQTILGGSAGPASARNYMN
jgi:two-component system, NarL family, nitrate/nitrite response regulator NarL